MTQGTFRIRPREMDRLREAAGYGLLNFGLAVETASKGHCPVRGGFRSFNPDQPIGGTLRRSIHVVAYIDGRRISPQTEDENGTPLPAYVPRMGLVVYIGTNSGYGFWVHDGTRRMAARPFLVEGFADERGDAGRLIAAGSRRHLGQ